MEVQSFKMEQKKAKNLWKEYNDALKKNPNDKFLQDMKKVYNQLRQGRKIIDIETVMEKAGINKNFEPRLAVAHISWETVACYYNNGGSVTFKNIITRKYDYRVDEIKINHIFPKLPEDQYNKYDNEKCLQASVPKIPASLKPKGSEGYYILWEVEKWSQIPPRDPYLLRRITDNMFVVLAAWDLTDLERAVMKGRTW